MREGWWWFKWYIEGLLNTLLAVTKMRSLAELPEQLPESKWLTFSLWCSDGRRWPPPAQTWQTIVSATLCFCQQLDGAFLFFWSGHIFYILNAVTMFDSCRKSIKWQNDSIYTEVELRQDCLSFSIFLSSKFFCVKVSHCFLLCLRSLLQWTDVLFFLFVCSLSIVLFCSFPIKLVLFRMLETANDLPFSSSPSLKSRNFAISLPLTSMCCFQSMCYGLPSEHKQQQRTGLWWKVVSFPPSPDELSISSPNAKCQKLCGGQRFELQFCLHHRGEQTRDGHAITMPKTYISHSAS